MENSYAKIFQNIEDETSISHLKEALQSATRDINGVPIPNDIRDNMDHCDFIILRLELAADKGVRLMRCEWKRVCAFFLSIFLLLLLFYDHIDGYSNVCLTLHYVWPHILLFSSMLVRGRQWHHHTAVI